MDDRAELIERLDDLTIEEQRVLARDRYPTVWQRTLSMPGKNRRTHQANLRKAAIEAAKCDVIRAKGGRCANCKHLSRDPAGLHGLFCDLESHWLTGYQRTKENNCCSLWAPVAKAPSALLRSDKEAG